MTYPEHPFNPPPEAQQPSGYPPPVDYPEYPPPVTPQSPVNYPQYPPSYPPPSPSYYPPPYQAGPSNYSGYSGYPGYPDPYDPYRAASAPSNNGLAIGSLVASILGFPLLPACYIGVAGWVAGIVLGIVALNQIKRTNQPGRGMAIGGIAVGAAGLVLGAIFLVIMVALLNHPTYSY